MNAVVLPPFFAAALSTDKLEEVTRTPGAGRDLLILLLVTAGVGLVLLVAFSIWFKHRRSHRHHHRHAHRRQRVPAPGAADPADADDLSEDPETGSHHHRRRRRRRDHRSRNPTLAETGGLPPPRPEGQVPPGL